MSQWGKCFLPFQWGPFSGKMTLHSMKYKDLFDKPSQICKLRSFNYSQILTINCQNWESAVNYSQIAVITIKSVYWILNISTLWNTLITVEWSSGQSNLFKSTNFVAIPGSNPRHRKCFSVKRRKEKRSPWFDFCKEDLVLFNSKFSSNEVEYSP